MKSDEPAQHIAQLRRHTYDTVRHGFTCFFLFQTISHII